MRAIAWISLFLLSLPLRSQEVSRFPGVQKGYFAFQYDNDFFNATDRYFTQGIRLEWAHQALNRFPTSKVLLSLPKKSFVQSGIAIEQQCFTPRSIRMDSVYNGERPYAATMFLSFFKKTQDQENQQSLETQLDLGIVGPCALCAQEQEGLHRALDNLLPLGWEFQLGSDVVINYSLLYEKGFYESRYFALMSMIRLRAGTLYTDAGLGLHLRTGFMPPYFAAPLKMQGLRLYAFVKGETKAVAYNTTLQGGIFDQNDPYTLQAKNIKRLVYKGTGGIVLAYKKISLEYTRIFITPEFDGGLSHGWGHCELRFLF